MGFLGTYAAIPLLDRRGRLALLYDRYGTQGEYPGGVIVGWEGHPGSPDFREIPAPPEAQARFHAERDRIPYLEYVTEYLPELLFDPGCLGLAVLVGFATRWIRRAYASEPPPPPTLPAAPPSVPSPAATPWPVSPPAAPPSPTAPWLRLGRGLVLAYLAYLLGAGLWLARDLDGLRIAAMRPRLRNCDANLKLLNLVHLDPTGATPVPRVLTRAYCDSRSPKLAAFILGPGDHALPDYTSEGAFFTCDRHPRDPYDLDGPGEATLLRWADREPGRLIGGAFRAALGRAAALGVVVFLVVAILVGGVAVVGQRAWAPPSREAG